MGARLRYAKVIDRELFYSRGGRIHPGLDNEVALKDGEVVAGAFLVLRAWTDDHGSFTEQWRVEGPGGALIYRSLPREMHLATPSHVEKLEDEITDLEIDDPDAAYQA
ncbi:MAG: hypothetical protein H0T12_04600, partial [Actinobacteria bacterium]|nr:hypothetical protein [Actinomycetota bacterium]